MGRKEFIGFLGFLLLGIFLGNTVFSHPEITSDQRQEQRLRAAEQEFDTMLAKYALYSSMARQMGIAVPENISSLTVADAWSWYNSLQPYSSRFLRGEISKICDT